MLKNKKAIYILIPVNILVWGFFIYRFWNLSSANEEPELQINTVRTKVLTNNEGVYLLSLDYKDPFLKEGEKKFNIRLGATVELKNKPGEKKPGKSVTEKSVTIKPIPSIQYLGLIKNQENGTATALVTFNGQSKLIKANEIIEGIVFKSFNKDSLVAKMGKEQIVVKR